MGWPSVSPDGTQLALAVTDRASRRISMAVVPTAGGKARTVVTLPEGYVMLGNRGRVLWGPNNNLIFMPASKQRAEVWSVRLDTGAATPLDLQLPGMMQPDLHPDGRRLLFRAGEVTDEIWALSSSSR